MFTVFIKYFRSTLSDLLIYNTSIFNFFVIVFYYPFKTNVRFLGRFEKHNAGCCENQRLQCS